MNSLKLARAMANLKPDDLAARLGMVPRYFEKLCHHPTPGFREAVERALGLKPGKLE